MMNPKKEFISIFKEHIHKDGADKLLEYLLSEKVIFSQLRLARSITAIMTWGL